MTGVWLRGCGCEGVGSMGGGWKAIALGNKAAESDAADPEAGAGSLVIAAKLLADLHTPPAEDVLAFVTVSGGRERHKPAFPK